MAINNFKSNPINLNLQNIKKDLDDNSKDKAKDKEIKVEWKNWENWVNSNCSLNNVKLLKDDEIKSLLKKN